MARVTAGAPCWLGVPGRCLRMSPVVYPPPARALGPGSRVSLYAVLLELLVEQLKLRSFSPKMASPLFVGWFVCCVVVVVVVLCGANSKLASFVLLKRLLFPILASAPAAIQYTVR